MRNIAENVSISSNWFKESEKSPTMGRFFKKLAKFSFSFKIYYIFDPNKFFLELSVKFDEIKSNLRKQQEKTQHSPLRN